MSNGVLVVLHNIENGAYSGDREHPYWFMVNT